MKTNHVIEVQREQVCSVSYELVLQTQHLYSAVFKLLEISEN